jgi:hypothetical protein
MSGKILAGGCSALAQPSAQEDWRSHPVAYLKCEDTTSENYLTALPPFLAKRVRLIDNATSRNQLTTLVRRVGASDKETVSHPQHASAHDDVAAAICGVITMALRDGNRHRHCHHGPR